LNNDRSSPGARADGGANRRAFTSTGNRSNHRADSGANARARYGAPGLAIVVLRPSLVINLTAKLPLGTSATMELSLAPE
jgi:hypothetical protein